MSQVKRDLHALHTSFLFGQQLQILHPLPLVYAMASISEGFKFPASLRASDNTVEWNRFQASIIKTTFHIRYGH